MEQTVVSNKLVNEESRILRECRGRRLALLGSVLRIQNSNGNGFYISSESASNRFYYVQYKENGNSWCSCPDFSSNRAETCKHVLACKYALRLKLVQTIDKKLPINSKKSVTDQYKNLSIRDLNEIEKAEIEAENYRTQRIQRWEDDTYDF